MQSRAVCCKSLVALVLLVLGGAIFCQWAEAFTVTFADPNLEAVIRLAIKVPTGPIDSSQLAATPPNPPQLTSLDASYSNIQNLSGLEYCTDLVTLQLNDNLLTDIGPLRELKNLQNLSLFDNQIVDVSPLDGLTSLRNVYLQNNRVIVISAFLDDTGLNSGGILNLLNNPLNQDALCNVIPELTARQVTVYNTGVCGTVVVDVPDPNLQKAIRVAINKPFGDLLDSDLANPAFTALDATGDGIMDLTGIDHCVSLNTLKLGGNRIASIAALSNLGKITQLYLGGNAISDLTPLKSLYGLNYLELQSQFLETPQPSGAVTRTRTLKNLDGIQYLVGLIGLVINDNNISDISGLNLLSNLMLLKLGDQQDDTGHPVLSDVHLLRGLTQLVSLDVGGNTINSLEPFSGLTALQALVVSHQYSLDASGNETRVLTRLDSADGSQNYLQPLVNLLLLDLSSNGLTDISPLAEISSLVKVYLNDNHITNIAALASLPNLAVVMLRNNQISDVSPLVANSGLGGNSFIQDVVDLTGNSLSQQSLCNEIPALQVRNVLVSYDGVCCAESDRFTLTTLVRGSGKVDPEGTGQFCKDTKVTIKATPEVGWIFDHWEGDLTGTDNPAIITMNSDMRITAVFGNPAQNVTLTVAVQPEGEGTVVPAEGTHTYVLGSLVSLTATPVAGWVFDSWTGDISGSANPTSVTMDASKTVTANFKKEGPKYTLTTETKGSGSISPASGPHVYEEGTAVSVRATPDIGWVFDHWEGDAIGPNPTTVVMTGNKSVTAVFRPDGYDYTLATVADGNGVTDPPVGFHRYYSGDTVTLTAIGDPGWVFDHWTGSITGEDNPVTLVMNEDKSVIAVFLVAPVTYQVSLSVQGSGAVEPGIGVHTYAAGKKLSLQATPAFGWVFDHWTGSLGGSANPAILTIDSDKSVTAVFRLNPYVIQVTPGSGTTLGGDTVTIQGGDLAAVNSVTFGGAMATIVSATDTVLTVQTPAHAHGAVDVTVTGPSGTATLASAFVYVDPPALPQIVSVDPDHGSAFGGTVVTIRGRNLAAASSVTFAGKESLAIPTKQDTLLVVVAPPYVATPPDLGNLPPLPFAADIQVTTPVGSAIAPGAYTYVMAPYIQDIEPAQAHVSGGDVITITGAGLANPTSVTFGGALASISTSTDSRLVVTVPSHAAGTVDVAVTNNGGSYVATSAFNYFTGAASITVSVYNGATQAPILNATVLLGPVSKTITGSQDGTYLFDRLFPGTYTVTVQSDQCQSDSQQVTVLKDQDYPVTFDLDCGSAQSGCGLQLKKLDSKITETSMPPSAPNAATVAAIPTESLALRVTSEDAIDPKSVWAAGKAGTWTASGATWRPTVSGDDRDGWVVFTPKEGLPQGQDVTLTVGATTVTAKTVGPLSQVFQIVAGKAAVSSEPALVEDPSVEPLPAVLATSKSPVYRITPAAVFPTAFTVQIPVPEGVSPGNVELYYYSESTMHPGWYRAENVVGWLVPDSWKTVEVDGNAVIEFQVNHAGVFQLGQAIKVSLGSVPGFEIGFSGSRAMWLSLASLLVILSAALRLLARRAKGN